MFSALTRKRIDLMSMLGVYVVLGVGMVVALLVLFAEIYWKRTGRRKLTTKVRTLNIRSVYRVYL